MLAQLMTRLHERGAENAESMGEGGPIVITEDCAVSILLIHILLLLMKEVLTLNLNRLCNGSNTLNCSVIALPFR